MRKSDHSFLSLPTLYNVKITRESWLTPLPPNIFPQKRLSSFLTIEYYIKEVDKILGIILKPIQVYLSNK